MAEDLNKLIDEFNWHYEDNVRRIVALYQNKQSRELIRQLAVDRMKENHVKYDGKMLQMTSAQRHREMMEELADATVWIPPVQP
jgi:hypothetical protein